METVVLRPSLITQDSIDQFFDAYAARFNDSLTRDQIDLDSTVNAFADCFIEASPAGVQCSKNDQQFKEAIPQGYALYKQTGMQAMVIEGKELTLLDEMHALVRVQWRSDHIRKDATSVSIPFEVIYLLQQQESGLKIFAYITGDEQKVMQEKGVLSADGRNPMRG